MAFDVNKSVFFFCERSARNHQLAEFCHRTVSVIVTCIKKTSHARERDTPPRCIMIINIIIINHLVFPYTYSCVHSFFFLPLVLSLFFHTLKKKKKKKKKSTRSNQRHQDHHETVSKSLLYPVYKIKLREILTFHFFFLFFSYLSRFEIGIDLFPTRFPSPSRNLGFFHSSPAGINT